jgi:hypothetical protein
MLKLRAQSVDGGCMAGYVILALLVGVLVWTVHSGLQNSPKERARRAKRDRMLYRMLRDQPEPVLREWERKRPDLKHVTRQVREVQKWRGSSPPS